jgi:hypothetical protein
MDLLPRDVQLIVYEYIHRAMTVTLNNEIRNVCTPILCGPHGKEEMTSWDGWYVMDRVHEPISGWFKRYCEDNVTIIRTHYWRIVGGQLIHSVRMSPHTIPVNY